ncbi:hypothetical protein [Chryseobacterium viscerum]|uniref:Uncharacterized protein n=1 Tax=Chryseobacterium viscerum TaxID=1037377 RepID=A0A316WAZ2_9FLAO|nr:hypothetical protein [Chryseobacterium viscerum]PWN58461.1 hypothetical protein C1634_023200 [Chryseobacterium viscerum]
MKISNVPTDYLLVKAFNECELCDFAIIHTAVQWRVRQKERMIAVTPFKNDDSFKWLNYKDESVDFFRYSDENQFQIQQWLSENNTLFIETNTEELKMLKGIDFKMSSYQMQVFSNGNAVYSCFEKNLGDEFWTCEFSLNELT